MAFYINEQLYFDFYLNGYQIPVTLDDVNSMAIVSNCYDILPALRLDMNDNKGIFSKNALTDGTVISIAIGTDQESAMRNLMEFVYISSPNNEVQKSKERYLIYAPMNYPMMISSQQPFGYYGTSSQVLRELGKKVGLSYDGIETSDEMVWLNGTKNYGEFMRYVTNHGYNNSRSCMMSAISLDKKIIYRDINDLRPEYTLTQDNVANMETEKRIMFKEIEFQDKSGINNYSYGYKNQYVEYNLNGESTLHSEITVDKETSVLNINRNVYDQVGLVGNNIRPINIGNYHNNWYKAEYQNKRYRALNSLAMKVYIDKAAPIDLLDAVSLSRRDPVSGDVDVYKANKWIVTAKTIAISGKEYIEKYILESSGFELDLFNTLT